MDVFSGVFHGVAETREEAFMMPVPDEFMTADNLLPVPVKKGVCFDVTHLTEVQMLAWRRVFLRDGAESVEFAASNGRMLMEVVVRVAGGWEA